ncbi:Rmf/CrpP fold protein [Streptomyces sp. NPDC059717]|uniref:Rmf/CrpP fold protein n=1 Tax=Streptomyces sp. NPDC059717 TaxID=3346922 RepID=UPI00368D8E07
MATSRTDFDPGVTVGPREQLVKALSEGAAAARKGDRVTACPYPAGDLRRSAWIRAYSKNRPLPAE